MEGYCKLEGGPGGFCFGHVVANSRVLDTGTTIDYNGGEADFTQFGPTFQWTYSTGIWGAHIHNWDA
jgi:hypothetical protein